MRRLAADPTGSREMGMNARRYIEAHFDRPALAQKLAELMESMVA
jgi:hypothetical protein